MILGVDKKERKGRSVKVGVTGGTGCLGRPLIERLMRNGVDVHVLARANNSHLPIFKKRACQVVIGDLDSLDRLKIFAKSCEIIFHLAGKVHSTPKTRDEEKAFFQVNVEGTRNLIKAAKIGGVKRIVYYSTVAVYGRNADFHGDETSPCHPDTVYAKSKLLAEKQILNSSNRGGAEGVVFRFPVVYGPLDRGNVAKLISAVYHRLFFYFGNGNNLRSMISSVNTAEAAIQAAFKPKAGNEIFCITDAKDYTLVELIDTIRFHLSTNRQPLHIPTPVAEFAGSVGDLLSKLFHVSFPINSTFIKKLSRPLTFSSQKAKDILDYTPVESLSEGIFKEVSWLKKINGWK